MIEDLLLSLAKLSPVISLLIVGIYYFYKKERYLNKVLTEERAACHTDISNLNKEMRENEKENIVIISKLSDVIDKLYDDNKDQHEVIKQQIKEEMRDIKELIKEKINELKNK